MVYKFPPINTFLTPRWNFGYLTFDIDLKKNLGPHTAIHPHETLFKCASRDKNDFKASLRGTQCGMWLYHHDVDLVSQIYHSFVDPFYIDNALLSEEASVTSIYMKKNNVYKILQKGVLMKCPKWNPWSSNDDSQCYCYFYTFWYRSSLLSR